MAIALVVVSCRGADTPRFSADSVSTPAVLSSGDSGISDNESARQFAQTFYDWYVPLSTSTPGTAYDSVLRQGSRLFTPTLRQALQRDVDAQRVAAGIVSVVGDYDPFLNTQDPCPRYDAREAVPIARHWQVAIDARCPDAPPVLSVLVDLVPTRTGWHIENFRRPDIPADDLLSRLRAAQAGRTAAKTGEVIPPMIVVLERDVRVERSGATPEQRGVLYGDTALRLRKGTALSVIAIGPEGGCRVRVNASTLALQSCPWLDGFTDHQTDFFRVRAVQLANPRQ